jgi:hypothetical protein
LVQVAIGLGRETRADFGGVWLACRVVSGVAGAAGPFTGGVSAFFQIGFDDLAQEVAGFDVGWRCFRGRGAHGLILGRTVAALHLAMLFTIQQCADSRSSAL